MLDDQVFEVAVGHSRMVAEPHSHPNAGFRKDEAVFQHALIERMLDGAFWGNLPPAPAASGREDAMPPSH